jgi:NAD(P)H-hydrate epimerase
MTVATAESVSALVAVQQAEIMTEALPEADDGGLAHEAGARALSLADARDALAVGPGLGTGVSTRAVVCEIVEGAKVPMVLDADGLNAIAPLAADGPLRDAADPRELVLTPHPGEAARLLSCTAAEIQADRLAAVRELARRSGAVVVLKGYRTLVTRPTDGRTAANASGNPGMATGGTGDVLTGAIAAFLARGLTAWDAARLAAFVHGAAGDRAAAELGPDGMIASDLVHRLPVTLASLAASRDD